MRSTEKSIIAMHFPIIGIALIILGMIFYLTGKTSAIAMGSIAIIAAHPFDLNMAGFGGQAEGPLPGKKDHG